MITRFSIFVLLLTSLSMCSCQKTGFLTRYGIFNVQNDTTITMNGTIGGRTDNHFNKLIENYPNIKWIELGNCPGSKNDEVNLIVAKQIHDLGINTRVFSDSEIASGAVDLFLAGNKRIVQEGSQIGVHSWAGLKETATDFPVGHENHLPYINYYVSVGFTQQEAEDFYYFTINAAPANSIHWMTEEEIEQYQLRTD